MRSTVNQAEGGYAAEVVEWNGATGDRYSSLHNGKRNVADTISYLITTPCAYASARCCSSETTTLTPTCDPVQVLLMLLHGASLSLQKDFSNQGSHDS